jgi:hypothetical protein
MTRNVGRTERVARLALGATALAAAARTTGWPRYLLGGVSAIGLGTGLTGYCPVNQAMGIDRYHPAAWSEAERDSGGFGRASDRRTELRTFAYSATTDSRTGEQLPPGVHVDESLTRAERLPRRGNQEIPPGKDISV